MPTHLRGEETATAPPAEASAAGERLEAGLAADQAERKRLREKWERRHRRAVVGARMVRTLTWRLTWMLGTPMVLAMLLCLFNDLEEVSFSFALAGGGLLVALLFVGTALKGMLEMAGEFIVCAARGEHVDLTSPAISHPPTSP